MSICYHCQKEIELSGRAGRKDTCSYCGADLHCCRNCKFYDESAHNQCKEPNSEWVPDRERGNFCDYFSFTPLDSKHLTGRGSKSPPSALGGLTGFTDKAKETPEADIDRVRAEALFKKG